MPTNLTGSSIASTYDQLLHVDDGPTATEKVVYSGTGVATALKVGTQSVSVDNIQLDGNTIQATTGSLTLGSSIAFASASNARTALGLGTSATQNSNSVTITGGSISGVTFSGVFTGITSIESGTFTTSNAAAGVTLTGNSLTADGTDTNINIDITPKGTGEVNITKVDIDSGSVLATTELGYNTGSGAGGSVTQLTSRTTGVTLNTPTGEITLFAAAISGHDADEFTLTNSTIGANDVIMLSVKSGVASGTRRYYQVHAVTVSAGSCVIAVGNLDNASIPAAGTESPVIQFVVLKGAVT
jgi:hypothetical protein